jgi:hypothetical protein
MNHIRRPSIDVAQTTSGALMALAADIEATDFDGREPFAHFDVEQIVSTLRNMAELGPDPDEPEPWERAWGARQQANDAERKR